MKKSYAMAIRDVTAQEMRRDDKVFVMGEDVEVLGGIFGCTRGLVDRVRSGTRPRRSDQ